MKITKKRHFFKNRWNAYFYNDSSAYGKTTAAPKRSFGLSRAPPGPPLGRNPVPEDPPGASRGRTISSRDPPWAPPRPTLAPPRPPQIAPGGPRSAQGPHQIHKVNMLKTLEIHTFALLGSQKNGLGRFFGPPRPPQRPSRVGPLIVRGAPGCPEGRLGAPRDPPRTPKDPPGSSQGPPRVPHGPPKAPPGSQNGFCHFWQLSGQEPLRTVDPPEPSQGPPERSHKHPPRPKHNTPHDP